MVDKANPGATGTPDTDSTPPSPPAAARRGGPFRGNDVRDSMAELAARAQLISQEAGTKVAAAMKDVVSAAAGIAGFAMESARDLVQYMVRRGQMTPEEGDKLLREAEQAHAKRPAAERERATATRIAADRASAAKAARLAAEPEHSPPAPTKSRNETTPEAKIETAPEAKPETKKAPAPKSASKSARKSAAKKETTSAAKPASGSARGAKAGSKSAKKPAAKKKR